MIPMHHIQQALAQLDEALGATPDDRREVPFYGPTLLASMNDKDQAQALDAEMSRYRQDPDESAVHFCLTAAVSLLEVSQVLLRHGDAMSPKERERQWKTLVVYTKTAGRSAYRAASILADRKD